jgi:predicted RNA binding protein YcfA (HicA-like mRNA interferase family)
MPRKVRELRADLRRAGFQSRAARGKGSHTFWTHRLLPSEQITLSGHDGDDAKPYQERLVRNILKKLSEVGET